MVALPVTVRPSAGASCASAGVATSALAASAAASVILEIVIKFPFSNSTGKILFDPASPRVRRFLESYKRAPGPIGHDKNGYPPCGAQQKKTEQAPWG